MWSGIFTLEKWLGDFLCWRIFRRFSHAKEYSTIIHRGHSAEHKRRGFEEYDGCSLIYWKWRETGSVQLLNYKKYSSFKPRQNKGLIISFNLNLPSLCFTKRSAGFIQMRPVPFLPPTSHLLCHPFSLSHPVLINGCEYCHRQFMLHFNILSRQYLLLFSRPTCTSRSNLWLSDVLFILLHLRSRKLQTCPFQPGFIYLF